MADERQARLKARARIDIKKLYEKGQITLKDHASAIGYLRGVWFDHLSDVEIEDFICREVRKRVRLGTTRSNFLPMQQCRLRSFDSDRH